MLDLYYKEKYHQAKIAVFIAIILLAVSGFVCNISAAESSTTESNVEASESEGLPPELQEYDGKRFGVQAGTTFDKDVETWFPNAKIVYYNTLPDLAVALRTGKIDAFPSDPLSIEMMKEEAEGLTMIGPYMDEYFCGFVFPKTQKGQQVRDEFDDWLTQAKESGAYDAMMEEWIHGEEEDKTIPDRESLTGEKGTLIFATEAGFPPFDYMRSGEVVGLEVDMAMEFCKDKGYDIEIVPMNFDGILPSIQAGKVDFAASGIAITEEREESINFSQPYYTSGTRIVVMDKGAGSGTSFFTSIKESIEKTFIREHRWKLFLEGSINTLLITIFSIIFGTLLGFSVYMLCRSRGIVVNTMTAWFTWLLQAMPLVVLLMILYYIVFGKTSLNGIVISIVGFTLVFGVAVFGMLKTAVSAVDRGQSEAACAIGCTPRQTFFRIILPQAFPFMVEPYKGEVIGLIKATSIVGYIAVLDLAKMGDLVRSRTYEAFFPLIAVMLFYFVLEGLLGMAVRVIAKRIDPKKRKKGILLKGVNLHD